MVDKELEVLNKMFGSGSVMLLNEKKVENVEVISTGSLGIDYKTGIWGIPVGRITSIKGWQSSGKTTLCLHLSANVTKKGQDVLYIDAEHEVDMKYVKNLGIDLDHFYISQPNTLEESLGLLEEAARLNRFSLIIFDSIAAVPTKKEIEGSIEDLQTGDKARLMSKHVRRMADLVKKSNTAFVYINQYRDKISFNYSAGKTVPGGHALDFRAALEIELAVVTKTVKIGENPIGSRIRIKILKNKLAPPYKEWEATIIWGQGFSNELDCIEIGTQLGIIKKSGAWFSYKENNIGQGFFKAIQYFKEHPEEYAEILDEIKGTLINQGV